MRFRHWAAGTWGRYKPLIRFVRETQCHVLAGAVHERPFARRIDHPFPIHREDDDLYLLTAAGVPLATLGVQWPHDGDETKLAYISALCAITNSGGGTLMVEHLKQQVAPSAAKGLRLEATAFSLGFWVDHNDFQPVVPNSLLLEWRPPSKKRKH